MPTNNFKPFGIGSGANVTDQTAYEALAALLTGFQSGKASSAQINKALRQGTVMASVLAQFIANSSGNDVLDNGDTAAILANLLTALNTNGGLSFLKKLNNLSEISVAGTAAQTAARANILAAALAGLATQVFSVATATANAHAVPLLQMNNALALKALLNGDTNQQFSAKDATANANVVNLGQMNTALALKTNLNAFIGGSNGNGVYYQFPGGLQICRFNVAVRAGGADSWSFPLAFASAPQVLYTTVAPSADASKALWINGISTTGVTFYNPNAILVNINMVAIL